MNLRVTLSFRGNLAKGSWHNLLVLSAFLYKVVVHSSENDNTEQRKLVILRDQAVGGWIRIKNDD